MMNLIPQVLELWIGRTHCEGALGTGTSNQYGECWQATSAGPRAYLRKASHLPRYIAGDWSSFRQHCESKPKTARVLVGFLRHKQGHLVLLHVPLDIDIEPKWLENIVFPGDLCSMEGAFQRHYSHQIAKVSVKCSWIALVLKDFKLVMIKL